jgi:hypothetical protein
MNTSRCTEDRTERKRWRDLKAEIGAAQDRAEPVILMEPILIGAPVNHSTVFKVANSVPIRSRLGADVIHAMAVIVTTNLPFSEWTTMFPNARLCKAMLDRLTRLTSSRRARSHTVSAARWKRRKVRMVGPNGLEPLTSTVSTYHRQEREQLREYRTPSRQSFYQ